MSVISLFSASHCHGREVAQGLIDTLGYTLLSDESVLAEANEWVSLVPNEKSATAERLSPVSVSGTLSIPIGRVRKLRMGGDFLGAFSVGDQLLWGAAEPLRRILALLREARG